jgi:hypothetical protein
VHECTLTAFHVGQDLLAAAASGSSMPKDHAEAIQCVTKYIAPMKIEFGADDQDVCILQDHLSKTAWVNAANSYSPLVKRKWPCSAPRCDNCGAAPSKELKTCSGCHKARYCSVECQKIAWRQHKIHCNK